MWEFVGRMIENEHFPIPITIIYDHDSLTFINRYFQLFSHIMTIITSNPPPLNFKPNW